MCWSKLENSIIIHSLWKIPISARLLKGIGLLSYRYGSRFAQRTTIFAEYLTASNVNLSEVEIGHGALDAANVLTAFTAFASHWRYANCRVDVVLVVIYPSALKS